MRILQLLIGCFFSGAAFAAPALPDDPAAAWEIVNQALRVPAPAIQIQGKLPSRTEMEIHRRAESDNALHCADLAGAFARKFPSHKRAHEARTICRDRLNYAVRRGAHDRLPELERVEQEILVKADLSPDQRFQMRAAAVERAAAVAQAKGDDMLAAYEIGVRKLQQEFPGRPEIAQMLYAVAVRSSGAKAKALANEVRRSATTADLKEAAWKLAARAERIGKPLRVKFTAVDGEKIDTANHQGKVVLIDFWATWSGPSIANLPKLTKLHERFADQGLVILGISTDHDRNALHSFINFKKIPWPQCFDNDPKTPSLTEALGVEQIPALWLIDRQGRLRNTNAGSDLETAVSELIREEPDDASVAQ